MAMNLNEIGARIKKWRGEEKYTAVCDRYLRFSLGDEAYKKLSTDALKLKLKSQAEMWKLWENGESFTPKHFVHIAQVFERTELELLFDIAPSPDDEDKNPDLVKAQKSAAGLLPKSLPPLLMFLEYLHYRESPKKKQQSSRENKRVTKAKSARGAAG